VEFGIWDLTIGRKFNRIPPSILHLSDSISQIPSSITTPRVSFSLSFGDAAQPLFRLRFFSGQETRAFFSSFYFLADKFLT